MSRALSEEGRDLCVREEAGCCGGLQPRDLLCVCMFVVCEHVCMRVCVAHFYGESMHTHMPVCDL